jgi:type IV secretory pathway TrbD component
MAAAAGFPFLILTLALVLWTVAALFLIAIWILAQHLQMKGSSSWQVAGAWQKSMHPLR